MYLLAFPPGITKNCISITIVNDTALENDEQFFILLTTNDEDVDFNPSVAEVIISDDDGKLTNHRM